MGIYKKEYERAITQVLSRYAEGGIRADTDLWPTIQERLARRTQPVEYANVPDSAEMPPRRPHQDAHVTPSRTNNRPHPFLGAAAALLGLLLLAGISWLAISGLAERQEKEALGSPTPVPYVRPSQDSSLIFSIPVGEKGIRYGNSVPGFFAAAPDGTFWVGSSYPRLLHYSSEGTLLGAIDIPSSPGYPIEMAAGSTDLWLLYATAPYRQPSMVYRLAPDGTKLAEYFIPSYLQAGSEARITGLMLGEHGEVLLKGSFDVPPSALTPSVPNAVPTTYTYTPPARLWQLVDADGNLAPKRLEGYTSNGKLYLGRRANEIDRTIDAPNKVFIKAGDVEFTQELPYPVFWTDVVSVEPDGSFYIVIMEVTIEGSSVVNPDYYGTLFHYAADGRLIERARMPPWTAIGVRRGPGAQFYILVENPDRVQRGETSNALPYSLEIYRLNFYRGEALPPTATPTPHIPAIPAQTTPTRVPNSAPISLAREGDGFRLDVYEGRVVLGSNDWIDSSSWIDSSHLVVGWTSPDTLLGADNVYSNYIIDVDDGKLMELPNYLPKERDEQIKVVPSPDGDKAVIIWEARYLRVALFDFATGSVQEVANIVPGTPQWAGPEINLTEFPTGEGVHGFAEPAWAGNDIFVLTIIIDRGENGPAPLNWGKVLLVDTTQQKVSVLAERGTVAGIFPDGAVLLRPGWIDGELQLFRPGDNSLTRVAPSGPWRAGWSFSPDGKQVAWMELTPPPGLWTQAIPGNCCTDPIPTLKGITVWDRTSGEVRRFDAPRFAWYDLDLRGWSQEPQTVWSTDSSALFYFARPTQDSAGLYRLPLNGQPTPVVETNTPNLIRLVAQGDDGSIYYMIGSAIMVEGPGCNGCVQLMRRYPDGKLEIVHEYNAPVDWIVDKQGRYRRIKDGGVAFTDLQTGQSHQVNFPGAQIRLGDVGWGRLSGLVPISPDGLWAAYAGSDSHAPSPDGRSNRGRTVHIVRVN
ncbi:MAG TPA: hypothetical protein VEX13_06640 [Chloroflexia bacterium]|nr:hypothetical protein [Chloroflexia bacterium]